MSGRMNPFVGLRPFNEEDAILFFGRSDQVDELLERLHRSRFVAVLGSSGSGKSSLVRAGLVPALRGGFLVEDRDAWDVVTMKPGQQPVASLAAELLRLREDGAPCSPATPPADIDVETLAGRIRESGADAVLELVMPRLQARRNLLLVVDQFEELFRFHLERSEPGGCFVDALLDLSSREGVPVYVVLTMRSDFLGDCDAFMGLTEAMNRAQYLVPRLTRQRRREAIEGPARLVEQRISARLLDRLLNESDDEPDQLPILQHVLMRTWAAAQEASDNGHALDVAHYEAVGGMAGALERDAEAALLHDPERVALARDIFQALTFSDAANRRLRRPGRISELASVTGASPAAVRELIAPFCDNGRSFLTITDDVRPGLAQDGADDPLIDISHESLIRRWTRLGAWVQAEAESAKTYCRLVETAQLRAESDADALSGLELRRMEEWWSTQRPTLAWALRYGTASDFRLASELLADSRNRQSQLEAAERRAQHEKLTRTQAVAKARFKYMGLLSVALVGALVAAVLLGKSESKLKGYHNAWASLDQALTDPRAGLLQAAQTLEQHPDLLAAQQAVLDQLARFGGSRIVADLNTQEETRTAIQKLLLDAEGRVLAFHQTGHRAFVSESPYQLVRAWNSGQGDSAAPWASRLQASDVDRFVASTPDGACLAAATADRRLNVWQRSTETGVYGPISSGLDRPFTAAALTDDCRWLAVGDTDGALTILDLQSGQTVLKDKVSDSPSGVVARMATGGSGWLAASTDSGALAVWRFSPSGWQRSLESSWRGLQASEGRGTHERGSAQVTAMTFSADGRHFVVGDAMGAVTIWRLPERPGDTALKAVQQIGHRGGSNERQQIVSSIEATEDGRWLVVSLQTGEFQLFNRDRDGWQEQSVQDKASPSPVLGVRISSDGGWLAVLTEEHAAFLWKLKPKVNSVGRAPWRPLRGHRGGQVNDVQFTADSRWLISGGADGVIRRWDLHAPDPVDASVAYRPPTKPSLTATAISADARWVATASSDGDVTVTAMTTAFARPSVASQPTRPVCSGPKGVTRNLTISRDNEWLACRYADGTLLLEALKGPVGAPILVEGGAAAADFSPDSRWLVAGQADGSVRIHEAVRASGEPGNARVAPVASLAAPEQSEPPLRVLTTEDRRLVASATGSGALYVWTLGQAAGTVRTGAPERLLPEAGSARAVGPLRALEASPDGAWIAAVDDQGTAFVWHRTGGHAFGGPVLRSSASQSIRAVAVGYVRMSERSHGRELALVSGASDGTICILPLDALSPRATDGQRDGLCGGKEPPRVLGTVIEALRLSRDGEKILARGREGRVWLFDMTREHSFAVIIGGRNPYAPSMLDAVLTADGRGVLTLSEDWSVRSWRFGHDELQEQVQVVAGRVVSQ